MTISRFRVAAPLLALTIALGLGACGDETEDPGGATDDTPTSSETQPPADDEETTSDNPGDQEDPTMTEQPPIQDGALPTGPVPDSVLASDPVQAAIADLAERESVEPDQVTAVGYFEVTWSDGSLGCPKPGMSYTMALVPGHLLVLEVNDQQFSYHGGREPGFSYCADPVLPIDVGGGATS